MKIRFALPTILAVTALALTGCVNNAAEERSDDGGGAKTTATITADSAAVALLPEEVKKSGKLRIGTDAEYPPNEFKDANGNPTGWGVELANAVAAKLGLEPKWEIMVFDSIIPRIQEDGLDMGSSSFTDTLERQDSVSFVDFLNAGSQWAGAKGSDVDPDNACGLTVSVQATTVQDTVELVAKNKACKAAGKQPIEVLRFDDQADVNQAVASGRADAMSADLPVTGDAVKKLSDKLQVIGDVFDAAPYGFAVKKEGEMAKAVQAALQSLMDDGTYLKILQGAGIESGALDEAVINGANK